MKKIGVLGAGQLGRMLALAGYPLELDFHFYDTSGKPCVGLGTITIDRDADISNSKLEQFIKDVDVVTYEFEHLPLPLTQHIESKTPLHPSSESLRVCQNRSEEKAHFDRLGIPTPKYRIIESLEQLTSAVSELGLPVVVKTTTEGYDGKGQFVIKDQNQCQQAWQEIGNRQLIVEAFVQFSRELSIIAVRSINDEVRVYPMAENSHYDGILCYSTAPAPKLDEDIQAQAESYIKDLMHELKHVGILTLELFETETGLIANEMAPRVHNSGHWSIEGSNCSQFENHLRAVAGLPLGCTQAQKPSVMINVLGQGAIPSQVLTIDDVKSHWYGKAQRAGRKMGHINISAENNSA